MDREDKVEDQLTNPCTPQPVPLSKIPEWNSKVTYYNHDEFLRMHLDLQHKVCGSLTVPVFEDDVQTSCCAVLEFVTTQEKPNFDEQMDAICNTLQGVELRSHQPPRLNSQSLSLHQNAALGEFKGVLHAICQAQQLPLALTWVPCDYADNSSICEVHVRGHNGNNDPNQKLILCIDELACYCQDKHMEGFVHACTTHPLALGQGIVGRSLLSKQPLFHPNVKQFHISEYPLVQHVHKFGLAAAIAIRVRSDYTGPDDYVLEFFLPGQENKVDKIVSTTEMIYKSLMKVPNIRLLMEKDVRVELLSCELANYVQPVAVSAWSSEKSAMNDEVKSEEKASRNVFQLNLSMADASEEAAEDGERGQKRRSLEKSISLSDLQQYLITGNIKHAVDSHGADQNTIKRVCRKNGIPRRPSRKIKKVNRSLKNTESMLESAEGVEGGSTFDPAFGELLAASSLVQLGLSKTSCLGKSELSADATTSSDKDHHNKKAPIVERGSTS